MKQFDSVDIASAAFGCIVVIAALGIAWWLCHHDSQAEDGLQRETSLVSDSAVIQVCVEAKEAIVQRLIDGRLGLAEAVAQVRAVEAKRPPHLANRLRGVKGDSEEERWANYLIGLAQSLVIRLPCADVVLCRLTGEREEYLAEVSSGHWPCEKQ